MLLPLWLCLVMRLWSYVKLYNSNEYMSSTHSTRKHKTQSRSKPLNLNSRYKTKYPPKIKAENTRIRPTPSTSKTKPYAEHSPPTYGTSRVQATTNTMRPSTDSSSHAHTLCASTASLLCSHDGIYPNHACPQHSCTAQSTALSDHQN